MHVQHVLLSIQSFKQTLKIIFLATIEIIYETTHNNYVRTIIGGPQPQILKTPLMIYITCFCVRSSFFPSSQIFFPVWQINITKIPAIICNNNKKKYKKKNQNDIIWFLFLPKAFQILIRSSLPSYRRTKRRRRCRSTSTEKTIT